MKKIILSAELVRELISKNRYRIEEKTKFLSRCIDGRYSNQFKVQSSKLKVTTQNSKIAETDLPALAFPGGDVGELALIFATANSYGFEVDGEKAYKIFIKAIGGEKNFGIHSDYHAVPAGRQGDANKSASDCGHWKQINLDPQAYNLEKDQIDFIQKKLDQLKKKKIKEIILEGEHLEGAVLLVKGSWGILPRYKIETDGGSQETQVFIYHQSLVDERHQVLASTWLKEKAVKLYNGCDKDYLYEALSEMAENHLMVTIKRLAKQLPIYEVKFNDDESFIINQL